MKPSFLSRVGEHSANITALLFRLFGWALANLCICLGLLVLAFFALGGFSIEGFFAHLDNLASRYTAASLDRRVSFHFYLMCFVSGAFVASGLLRLGSLGSILKRKDGHYVF